MSEVFGCNLEFIAHPTKGWVLVLAHSTFASKKAFEEATENVVPLLVAILYYNTLVEAGGGEGQGDEGEERREGEESV